MAKHATAAKKHSEEEIALVEHRLGYVFRKKALVIQALTASSADHHHHYELLEFFGDGILRHIIPNLLYERYPHANQSDLSRMYGVVSCNATLAHVALRLSLSKLIRVDGAKHKVHFKMLADVVEALVAAIEMDSSTAAVEIVCQRLFRPNLELVRFDRPIELLTRLSNGGSNSHRISFHIYPRTSKLPCPGYVGVVTKGHKTVVHNGEAINAEWAMYNAAALALLKLYPKAYPTLRGYKVNWRL